MYDFGIRQARTGYRVAYRPDEANHCPGCGGSQWIIGRMTAECAHCSTAVPLVATGTVGTGLIRTSGKPAWQHAIAA
ncbi:MULTISPECIES: hypothetical protein [unclassified Sphingosinithalassobacter]|uniref:hypothetical protein n=1 Tax=unclassified Sphingosinithalassobacter TaxID=2676235 RepID=UPI00165D4AF9|nr:hypothetical protein [Sphingosinithalassobacter sp. CS137]